MRKNFEDRYAQSLRDEANGVDEYARYCQAHTFEYEKEGNFAGVGGDTIVRTDRPQDRHAAPFAALRRK